MSDKKKSIWDRVSELMLKSQTTSPTSVTGGDAYGARAMQAFSEGDVEKAKEIQREEDKASTKALINGATFIGGATSTGLLSDLIATGLSTAATTTIDGNLNNLGKNLTLNAGLDLLGHGGGKLIRILSNIPVIKRLKTTYTGVRHIPLNDNPKISMDEVFPNFNGTIWTSDNIGYAKQWINGDNGKIFQVLIDPKKINMLETPIAESGHYFPWANLPYRATENGIKLLPNTVKSESAVFKTMEDAWNAKRPWTVSKEDYEKVWKNTLLSHSGVDTKRFNNPIKAEREGLISLYKTDDLVKDSEKLGYNGVNINTVYDGPVLYRDEIIDIPVNESVYNPNTPHWVLPEGKSKWSLLLKDLNNIVVKKQGGKLKLQPGGKMTPEHARLLGRRGMPGDKEALAAAGYNSKGQPLVEFGGGSFGSGGAGASWNENGLIGENYDYVRNTPILQSFSDAFNNARKAGLSSFTFNGKKYTTEISDNPNYIGKKYQPLLNIREVLDKNMKVMSDSTRIEPYVGQIPGTTKRDK